MISFKTLSEQEINSISQFDSNKELLAIDNNSKIVKIAKDELTVYQRLISYIGLGPLAGMNYKFNDVTSHLNQYSWSEGVSEEEQSPQSQAYLKVCALAMKALVSKNDTTLYDNVGKIHQHPKSYKFSYFVKGQFRGNGEGDITIKWNPLLQVKHLDAILAQKFPSSSITSTVKQNCQLFDSLPGWETILDKETIFSYDNFLPGTNINVEQHIHL